MARYNILSINKMSSGNTRGLLDMTIAFDYRLLQSLLLLDKTPKSDGSNGEDEAIATETGDYKYARTEYISDFKPTGTKSPLSKEQNVQHLILNETQKQIDASTLSACHHHSTDCEFYEQGDGPSATDEHYAIQLTPESWLSGALDIDTLHEFNASMARMRVIYEFEKSSFQNKSTVLVENATSQQLLPLNDILDVCVKSQFKKTRSNFNIPGNLIFSGVDNKTNSNIDIYLEFEKCPIGFCQCNNGAFMLSQPTTKQPYMLQSNLLSTFNGGQAHKFQLVSDPIKTVLYNEPSRYSSGATQYVQLSTLLEENYSTQETALSVFEPQANLLGIEYNYIVGIDQMANTNRIYDNQTIYSNGDIYGSFALTKSMFNPLYSMQMPNKNAIHYCRTYCGIENAQNNVLLKYFDNVYYTFNRDSQDDDKNVQTTQSFHAGTLANKKYPYQKVEFFYPNQMASETRHKSNLFSIKIYDSGLDDDSIEDGKTVDKRIAEQIKRDIFNGVKALADSIAPANTQLFKTYYMTT